MQDNKLIQSYQERISQLTLKQKHALAEKLSLAPDKAKAKLMACVTMTKAEPVDSKVLRDFAHSVLPEHFVPQVWEQVQALPRTSVGKIQRKNAQSFPWQRLEEIAVDDGFDIFGDDIFGESTYHAPSNETEAILAKIWSDVLGSGDISIHDEFLEVGGDSLLSIRILARINKAGLNIATEDFFEFPTIAGQAKAIAKASEHSYEEGSTKGQFALIPIQQWLFDRVQVHTQHWNQSILFAVDETLDFSSLERAFQKVLLQHDALRLAFIEKPAEPILQAYLPIDTQLNVDYIDICTQHEQAQNELIEQHCQLMNKSMTLSEGNLARIAFFETRPGSLNKLAIVVHHLIIDAESWRILLDDLQSCWLGFAQGVTPILPRKTTSFKHWSEKLGEYAQSQELSSEIAYWQAQSSQIKLPVDVDASTYSSQKNTVGSGLLLSTSLDKENTALLLKCTTKKLKTKVKDLLITALVTVMQRFTGNNQVLIDIEGHGREDLFESVDISRTIGWFTTVFPTLFNINPNDSAYENLLSVSNTLKAIPKNGIGHGILHQNNADTILMQLPNSEVCFNYLGQVDGSNGENEASFITPISTNIGTPRDANCLRAFHIEVNAKIEHSQLHIDWSYSKEIHNNGTIEHLASEFIETLTELLTLDSAAVSEENDDDDDIFDLTELDDSELDAITKALSDK